MPERRPVERQPPPARRPFQFGVGKMLLAVLPISVLAAAWAGMMGLGADHPRLPQGFFVLMAAAAPMALTILISVAGSLFRRAKRPRHRR